MNRRAFIGSFFASWCAATILPKLPVTPAPLNFGIEESIGYVVIHPDIMADGFAEIFRHDISPIYMFMHPLEYKMLNPEGYAELVRQQQLERALEKAKKIKAEQALKT